VIQFLILKGMTVRLRNCQRLTSLKYQSGIVFQNQLYWIEQLTTLFAVQEVLNYFFIIHFYIVIQNLPCNWTQAFFFTVILQVIRSRLCSSTGFIYCHYCG